MTALALLVVASLVVVTAVSAVLLVRGALKSRAGASDLEVAVATGQIAPSIYPRIDPGQCIGTAACVRACPETDVIAVVGGQARLANPASCIGHSECLRACPVDAITLVLGSPDAPVHVPTVDTDFQTATDGLYVAGELGGMGLIYNAMVQGIQCARAAVRELPAPVEGVHQLVVVGAGPAGLAATLQAMEAGVDVVTLEQDRWGGAVVHFPRHKLVMTRSVKLPLYGKLRLGEVRKEELLRIWAEILEKTGVQIRSGIQVVGVEKQAGAFALHTAGGEVVRAQRVILALGRRGSPRTLDVPGEDLPKVVYRLEDPETYTGRRCLVVGGGDSAVESAVALGEAGAEVVLSYRRSAFRRIKRKNQKHLDAAVAKGLVTLKLGTELVEVTPGEARLRVGDEVEHLENDAIIVNIGGTLPTEMLREAGIEVSKFTGEQYVGSP